jgi:carbon-monoxide dehydrogenase large subunit
VRIDQLPITPRLIVEALARQREQQANTLKGMPA